MAYKDFKPNWTSIFSNGSHSYNGHPFRAGGSSDYHSFLSFPDEIKDAVRTSTTTAKLSMRFRVRQGSQVDFGWHNHSSRPTGNLPFYGYVEAHNVSKGWQNYGMSNYFLPKFMNNELSGLVFYSTTHYSIIENSGSNDIILRVEGTWNNPPYKPTVTSPDTNQRVDESVTVRWNNNGDPDGDNTRFYVSYKDGSGRGPDGETGSGNWSRKYSGWNDTSMTFDTSDWAEGNNARFAIRSEDPDGLTSSYDYSKIYTINHNKPPTKPDLTSPNGGETWNKDHVVYWNASTDPNNDDLEYQVQLSTNIGSSWDNLIYRTSKNATFLTYNFENEDATSIARIRVRAYDGEFYSDWDESDGVFAIQHNLPPDAPTDLKPNGIVINSTITNELSWTFNDPNVNDSQSEADIQWRKQGSSIWNDINVRSSDTKYYIPQNTFPDGQIEWRVRTYDQGGIVGVYSNSAVFTASEPTNTPTITKPDDPVNIARPIISWTGGGQESYQVRIFDASLSVLWDTGEINSTAQARTAGVDLINGARYGIQVRTKDDSGLFSSYASIEILVSYTPPPNPSIQADVLEAGIRISVVNPTPTGTQPDVTYNNVYKRVNGDWVRIATHILNAYVDYSSASEEKSEYRVRAISEDNDTFADSNIVNVTAPKLQGVWIYDVNNPADTITQYLFDGGGRNEERQTEHSMFKFAGRNKPVIEFGNMNDYTISANVKIMANDELKHRLDAFIKNRNTVMYRDGRGKKIYGVIPQVSYSEIASIGYEVAINVIEIDHTEEV